MLQNNQEQKEKKQYFIAKYKISVTILSLLIIIVSALSPFTIIPQRINQYKIHRAIIRKAAAASLGKEPDQLTKKDYKKVTNLNLSNSSIYGHNLTPRGSVSPFKNIEPLSSLMNLTDLDLSGTYVLSIEPIKNFRNLQELDISYTDIFDFEPLKELKNLQRLRMIKTKVSDLEPLKGLTKLRTLSIINTKVSDLEPLKELTNLQALDVSYTHIPSLEPLKELTNLEWLEMNNSWFKINKTKISNLEPLKELKNLQRLIITNCPDITDQQVEDLQKALPDLKIYQ